MADRRAFLVFLAFASAASIAGDEGRQVPSDQHPLQTTGRSRNVDSAIALSEVNDQEKYAKLLEITGSRSKTIALLDITNGHLDEEVSKHKRLQSAVKSFQNLDTYQHFKEEFKKEVYGENMRQCQAASAKNALEGECESGSDSLIQMGLMWDSNSRGDSCTDEEGQEWCETERDNGNCWSDQSGKNEEVQKKCAHTCFKCNPVIMGDFSQCKSRGGNMECTKCDHEGGLLPCTETSLLKGMNKALSAHLKAYGYGKTGTDCPGLKTGSYFASEGSSSFCRKITGHPGVTWDDNFMGVMGLKVLSKALAGHSHGTDLSSGWMVYKRTVYHEHNGTTLGDVFKDSVCLKCPYVKISKFNTVEHNTNFPPAVAAAAKKYGIIKNEERPIFHSTRSVDVTANELHVFAQECVAKAYDGHGNLNQQYACQDEKYPWGGGTYNEVMKAECTGTNGICEVPGEPPQYWKPTYSAAKLYKHELMMS